MKFILSWKDIYRKHFTGSYWTFKLSKLRGIGAKKFGDATRANIGKQLGIYLDNFMLLPPTINSAIVGDSCIIGSELTEAEADRLTAWLSLTALPFELITVSAYVESR